MWRCMWWKLTKIKNKFVCPANRDDSALKRRSAPSLFVCLRTGSSQEISFCTCEFRRRSAREKVATLEEIFDVCINFNIATVIYWFTQERGTHPERRHLVRRLAWPLTYHLPKLGQNLDIPILFFLFQSCIVRRHGQWLPALRLDNQSILFLTFLISQFGGTAVTPTQQRWHLPITTTHQHRRHHHFRLPEAAD
jgi:hypothetical protein